MEATITLKASPREFDQIRAALTCYRAQSLRAADDLDLSIPARRDARLLADQLAELQGKLGNGKEER